MKPKKHLLTLFKLLLSFSMLAQSLLIIPPNILPTDCVPVFQIYSGTVVNNTEQAIEVFAAGQVYYGSSFSDIQLIAEGTTSNFTVPVSGITITTQTAEQYLYPIDFKFYDTSLENTYFNTGCLVPGFYQICIQLVDYQNPIGPLGQPNILGNICYEFEIQVTTPLLLVSPFDGNKLDTPLPLFTWTVVSPNFGAAYYQLEIVEIFGVQSPFQAFQANPIYFQEKNLLANVLLYPISARPFDPCRKYAWRVNYVQNNGNVVSTSEIWTFKTSCGKEQEIPEKKKKKRSEEDASIPKTYLTLKLREEGDFYPIYDKKLRFIFDNFYEQRDQVDYQVLDIKGNPVPNQHLIENENDLQKETPQITTIVETGDNRLVLDLEQLELKEEGKYTLLIQSRNQSYFLRFQMKKRTNGF